MGRVGRTQGWGGVGGSRLVCLIAHSGPGRAGFPSGWCWPCCDPAERLGLVGHTPRGVFTAQVPGEGRGEPMPHLCPRDNPALSIAFVYISG